MIAHLRGKLLTKHPNQVVVETCGVGYEVNISVPTFSELPANGSEVALHIHTHVREDVIALYGFLRPAEKQLFEKLMTVSGIGAKLAITILSGMAADEIQSGAALHAESGGNSKPPDVHFLERPNRAARCRLSRPAHHEAGEESAKGAADHLRRRRQQQPVHGSGNQEPGEGSGRPNLCDWNLRGRPGALAKPGGECRPGAVGHPRRTDRAPAG